MALTTTAVAERRFRWVTVPAAWVADLFRVRQPGLAYRATTGVPLDATLVGDPVVSGAGDLNFLYAHPAFDPVPFGDPIPVTNAVVSPTIYDVGLFAGVDAQADAPAVIGG